MSDTTDKQHPAQPDTELAAAIGFLARNEGLLIEMENSPAGRAAATIVRAVLARPADAPQHLVRGDRVETVDGVRATVTGPAPRGPHGEPAVNLDWDGDAGGPAYEHGLRRVVDVRPAAGRDLTADDVRGAWHDVPSYSEHDAVFQHIADRLNGIAR